MRSIITERSKEAMQVVGIYRESSDPVRKIANAMSDEKLLNDCDVYEFSTLLELNNFLLANLKI